MAEFKEHSLEELQNIRGEEYKNRVWSRNMTKKHIRFIAITRIGISCRRHDVAILTSDMQFYEFQMKFALHSVHLSHMQYAKILKVFSCFIIDDLTELVVQDTVYKNCPIMFYFNIIKPYAKFKMLKVGLPQVIGRICYYRRNLGRTKRTTSNSWASRCLHDIWKRLVASRECPFITKGLDDKFALAGPIEASHHKRIRIFMYYMLLRRMYSYKAPEKTDLSTTVVETQTTALSATEI